MLAGKSDAVVEVFPNRNHSNLIDKALRMRIHKEMAHSLRKNLPQHFGNGTN